MLVKISECKIPGRLWRYCSRSKNKKIALRKAIKKYFGENCFFHRLDLQGGRYGLILRRIKGNSTEFDIVVNKVRITIED